MLTSTFLIQIIYRYIAYTYVCISIFSANLHTLSLAGFSTYSKVCVFFLSQTYLHIAQCCHLNFFPTFFFLGIFHFRFSLNTFFYKNVATYVFSEKKILLKIHIFYTHIYMYVNILASSLSFLNFFLPLIYLYIYLLKRIIILKNTIKQLLVYKKVGFFFSLKNSTRA